MVARQKGEAKSDESYGYRDCFQIRRSRADLHMEAKKRVSDDLFTMLVFNSRKARCERGGRDRPDGVRCLARVNERQKMENSKKVISDSFPTMDAQAKMNDYLNSRDDLSNDEIENYMRYRWGGK